MDQDFQNEPTPEEVASMFREDGASNKIPKTPPVLPKKPGSLGRTTKIVIGAVLVAFVGFAFLSASSWVRSQAKPKQQDDSLAALNGQAPTTPDPSQVGGAIQPQLDRGKDMANRNKEHKQIDQTAEQGTDPGPDVDTSSMTTAQRAAIGAKEPPAGTRGGANNEAQSRAAEEKNKRELARQAALDSSPVAVDYSSLFNPDGSLRSAGNQFGGQPTAAREQGPADSEARAQAEGRRLTDENTPQEAKEVLAQNHTQDKEEQTKIPGGNKADAEKTVTTVQLGSVVLPDGRTGYRLNEGTLLETVLKNRTNGALSGLVLCQVDANVYSNNRQHLLIPQGATLVGNVTAVGSLNQERLFVAFHRLIMNNGESVSLDQFKAMNVAGETGLKDIVNRHYMQIFGAAAAIAAIGAVQSVGNSINALDATFSSQYRQTFAQQMGQAANQILARFINILPTFIIREGAKVKIYLSNDIILPEYNHRLMD
jgi:type IV secretory pathway VirB10-like protein